MIQAVKMVTERLQQRPQVILMAKYLFDWEMHDVSL